MPNTLERKLDRALESILQHLGITRIPKTTDSWALGPDHRCQQCTDHNVSCEVSGLAALAIPGSLAQHLPNIAKDAHRALDITFAPCDRCTSFKLGESCRLTHHMIFTKNAPTQVPVEGWVLETPVIWAKDATNVPSSLECRAHWGEGVEMALNDAWEVTARLQHAKA